MCCEHGQRSVTHRAVKASPQKGLYSGSSAAMTILACHATHPYAEQQQMQCLDMAWVRSGPPAFCLYQQIAYHLASLPEPQPQDCDPCQRSCILCRA